MTTQRQRRAIVMEAVRGLLKKYEPGQRCYKQLRDRGLTDREAREEIGRAFLGTMWEHWHNLITPLHELLEKPEIRWLESVLRRLGAGDTTSDIWPDESE